MAEIKDSNIVKYKSNKVEIKKVPNKGDNISVYVRPGDEIDFLLEDINLADLDYKLVGGDIIIEVPDQGSFTFVSMALMGYNDTPPFFNFGVGGQLSLGAILSAIEEVNDLPLESVPASIEVKIDQEVKLEAPEVTPQPIIIVQDVDDSEDFDAYSEDLDAPYVQPLEDVEPVEETPFTDNESKKSSSTEDNTAEVEGVKPTLRFDIDVQHVSASEPDRDSQTHEVQGGGGTQYTNNYPDDNKGADLKQQTDPETIDTTDKTTNA
ncbi:hypothetical protein ADUPG1_001514, partial [Aduncisulcus paluster]